MEINQPFTLTLPLDVAEGGTGKTSFTPYAVITGGTTSIGALQNVSGLGTSGQVLTSNGTSALPTWQDNGNGNVTGPASSTLNAIPRYADTTGKLLGNSTIPVRLDNNGVFQDNGINGAVGKSVDPVNHVLWSGDSGSGSIPFIDFTGNGGGGSLPSGWYMAFDRGEQNIAFAKSLADTNFNQSISVAGRVLYGGSGVSGASMVDWGGPTIIMGAAVNMGVNSITNVNGITMSGAATLDMSVGSINNADNITAAHFYGDGASITGLSASNVSGLATVATSGAASDLSGLSPVATTGQYSDLSGSPIGSSAYFNSDIHAGSYSLFFSYGLYIKSEDGAASIDVYSRILYASDGSTPMLNWSTAGHFNIVNLPQGAGSAPGGLGSGDLWWDTITNIINIQP